LLCCCDVVSGLTLFLRSLKVNQLYTIALAFATKMNKAHKPTENSKVITILIRIIKIRIIKIRIILKWKDYCCNTIIKDIRL
jgi:hypothetical protein